MDERRNVSSPSTVETESFFTSGSQAYPSKCPESTLKQQLRASIASLADHDDFPGPEQGLARAIDPDMPGIGSVAEGRPHIVGEMPESLLRLIDGDTVSLELGPADVLELRKFAEIEQEREGLLIQLLFASKDLAERVIQVIAYGTPIEGVIYRCRECRGAARKLKSLVHRGHCNVNRVLRILRMLEALPGPVPPQDSKLTQDRKETAPEKASLARDRAGDGIRALGEKVVVPLDLLCLECGERGGTWGPIARWNRGDVAKNHQILGSLDGRAIWVYAHACMLPGEGDAA